MTDIVMSNNPGLSFAPDRALKTSATLCFVAIAAGMWIFTIYLAVYYGSIVVTRGWAGLYDTYMPKGFVAGDAAGNALLGAHILAAIAAMSAGPLQLMPRVRARAPAFHRWTGRIFMAAAVVGAASGPYLTWARPTEHVIQSLGISLNAVLILTFAAFALRFAKRRKIDIHGRWALRLFLVVGAPLFLRIGYTLWFWYSNLAGVGFDRLFDVLTFAQYLVPLAILEIYLRTKNRGGVVGRYAAAAGLLFLAVVIGFGTYLATTGMWLPRASSMR